MGVLAYVEAVPQLLREWARVAAAGGLVCFSHAEHRWSADERGVRAHAHARSLVKAYSVDAVRERLAADAAIAPLFGVSLRPGRWGALLLVLLMLASTVWRAPCTVAITGVRVWLRRHTISA